MTEQTMDAQRASYCGNHPQLDHSGCPSSTECAHAMCDSCGGNPSGYGHFTLYCRSCAGEPTQQRRLCCHPRSCRDCDVAGIPCGAHVAGTAGHERCTGQSPVSAERYLTQLEAQVRIARQALADEHEGNFTRAVQLIAQDAEELMAMVSKW